MNENDRPDLPPAEPDVRRAAGEQIKAAREKRGWSQARLAKEAGTSQQTIDRVERGVTLTSKAYPGILKALAIDVAGSIPPDFLSRHGAEWFEDDSARVQRLQSALSSNDTGLSEFTRVPNLSVFARLDPEPGQDVEGLVLIDSIPRPYPVVMVEKAYGLVVYGRDMRPAYRSGDIIIVNPLLPLVGDADIVLFKTSQRPTEFLIRAFHTDDDENWFVSSWQPREEHVKLPKSEWPIAKMVVSKISRFR